MIHEASLQPAPPAQAHRENEWIEGRDLRAYRCSE